MKVMQGIERIYCEVCINAVIGAWVELMDSPAAEVLREVDYGKVDTLGLDATPEITIKKRLESFDECAMLITEELDTHVRKRWPTDVDPAKQPLMFFSDPTDRSIELEKYIKHLSSNDHLAKVGDLMAATDRIKVWEEISKESPAIITGASSSITCIHKGKVIFSVILNFITGTLFTSTPIGVYQFQLLDHKEWAKKEITLTDVIRKGKPLSFPSVRERGFTLDDCRRFSTFLGKTGYYENFIDSKLFVDDPDKFIHHRTPPGPPRVLYLSELQKKEENGAVGFVLYNGEKIGEWIHSLAFAKYARNEDGEQALRIFEISLKRPYVKYGMLMSTPPDLSLFNGEGKCMTLDMSRLRTYEHPSQFRSMLVVLPADNERICHVLHQHQYRDVTDAF